MMTFLLFAPASKGRVQREKAFSDYKNKKLKKLERVSPSISSKICNFSIFIGKIGQENVFENIFKFTGQFFFTWNMQLAFKDIHDDRSIVSN